MATKKKPEVNELGMSAPAAVCAGGGSTFGSDETWVDDNLAVASEGRTGESREYGKADCVGGISPRITIQHPPWCRSELSTLCDCTLCTLY